MRYKVDELQEEIKRLNRMIIAMEASNQLYMDFIVSINKDLDFFKFVKKQRGGFI